MSLAAEYNRRVEEDLRSARAQARWLEEAFRIAGITFDGQPMRTCLRPHFVARADWDALRAEAMTARGELRRLRLLASVADALLGPVSLRPRSRPDRGTTIR